MSVRRRTTESKRCAEARRDRIEKNTYQIRRYERSQAGRRPVRFRFGRSDD